MGQSRSSLTADLRALGVRAGDVVMVHASLRAIGPVEEGAAGVVQALEHAVGSTGTLLMTLGARDDFDWVNTRPEQQRADLLADAPPRRPTLRLARHTSRPRRRGASRGLPAAAGHSRQNHPDARFGARGRLLADALLADPLPWDDYYGPGSVLERFVGAPGKVLRLGADPDTVTLLHLAENLVELPRKRRVVRHHKVVTPSRTVVTRTVSCLDDTDGIIDWPGEDYFSTVLHDYLNHHRANIGRVGNAHSELIDSGDLLHHAVTWMHTNFTTRSDRRPRLTGPRSHTGQRPPSAYR
jgi:aminoglycoside N3'-acetyltransferase